MVASARPIVTKFPVLCCSPRAWVSVDMIDSLDVIELSG
jgi:hypothetical protein